MNPITHALMGWAVANTARLDRRDRALIVTASVVPDVDGLGVVIDWATALSGTPTDYWGTFHHVLGHNIGFALFVALLAALLGKRKPMVTCLVIIGFHLHLLGDVIGARGPDGDQWPIPYLLPFSDAVQLAWNGQWALNAWPNFLITALLIGLALFWACQKGYSPVELVSPKLDQTVVKTLRNRFNPPKPNVTPPTRTP